MINVSDIVREITVFCEKNADPKLVEKYSRYFTEGYDAYGIDQKAMEAFREERFPEWTSALAIKDVYALTGELFRLGKYEFAGFGVWMLARYKKEWDKSQLPLIREWLDQYIKNWAHCDVLCGEIVTEFIRGGAADYRDLAPWLVSDSRWTRRAVPVSLWKTITPVNVVELLEFLRPLTRDAERVVGQGMGWFLREAWKRVPAPVEDYLLSIKDYALRIMIQYATEKMTKEQKERYRKAK
ncbi:MAG: hypothetical protein A2Y33_06370 [Spirochaetes bacterium GWF1_51_8]|nr:MAG: hypothetical protein A2Y33_06370 [Spirochaetes bacterium GWF1_51_8]